MAGVIESVACKWISLLEISRQIDTPKDGGESVSSPGGVAWGSVHLTVKSRAA